MKRLAAAGCKPPHVQVNGDSGNDIDLFKVPGVVGCVVSNAHPELRQFAQQADKEAGPGGAAHIFQATQPCAGGILEALQHFSLLPPALPGSSDGGSSAAASSGTGGQQLAGDTAGQQLHSGVTQQTSAAAPDTKPTLFALLSWASC
ncbi:sucrose-phosphatase 1, partial [Haematococcus lacustris]